MEKSILKSFSPIIANGFHSTYANDKGTYYKFTVEFENGDKGSGMSKNEKPSWKIGEEYTYEKSVNGNYTNFKGIKSAIPFIPGGNGGGFKQKSPKEFGLEAARKFFNCCAKCETFDQSTAALIKTSNYIANLTNTYDRAAIETAFTRAGTKTMSNNIAPDSADIIAEIKALDEFLKS